MTTNTQSQTQQSGGDELKSYFVETIARYTNAPRIPELAAKLARYVQAREREAERAARIDELTKVQVSLRAFVNGTSTFPAADELLEIADHLQQLKSQAGEGGEV